MNDVYWIISGARIEVWSTESNKGAHFVRAEEAEGRTYTEKMII